MLERSTPSGEEGNRRYFCKCGASYSGIYGKGNLGRHRREKGHGLGRSPGREHLYPCEDARCLKSYKRQDARLKHYRLYHKDLAKPAMRRKL